MTRWSEARARCDAASDGRWHHVAPKPDGTIHRVLIDADPLLAMSDTGYSARSSWDQRAADATFIAAARTDLPAALDAIDAVLALHAPAVSDRLGVLACPICLDGHGYWTPWPCPTAAALGVTE